MKSITPHPTLGAACVKHGWAHSGMAIDATGAQSADPAPQVAEPAGGDESAELPCTDDDGEDVGVVTGGVVVALTVAQGVVGLAATQAQSELTDWRRASAVLTPQSAMTQFCAALWMTDDEAHWHW